MFSLLGTPQFMLGMTVTYLASIKDLQVHMENRGAYSLKTIMQVYNLMQIFLNAYMVYGLCNLPFLPEKPNVLALNVPYNDNLRYFINVHYLSKYFDYFDTFFMILRKKNDQLSFLHIYHHTTVCFVWGYLVYIGHDNGTAGFTALFNSIIHTIMYGHYFLTSFGYRNPLKRWVTHAQFIQFISFFLHSIAVMLWEKIYPRPLALIELFYSLQMIVLFGDFYKQRYLQVKEE